jgi:hypothetical protein
MTTSTETALDLDAIKANDYQPDRNGAAAFRQSDLAAQDVPALVAEVERLRKGLAEMDEAAIRAIRAEASAVRELEQENARLRAELGRPLTAEERAFQDGV